MNKKYFLLFVLFICVFALIWWQSWQSIGGTKSLQSTPTPTVEKKMDFLFTSSAFEAYQKIPQQYTCDGVGNNPPLSIVGTPTGTKTFALIVDDPDTSNGTFTHWLMWNIPPDTKEIASEVVPKEAVQGVTSAGKPGYRGPCPPSGVHRYFFTLYALDTQIGLEADAKKSDLTSVIMSHTIAETRLVGVYSRK